VFPLTAVADYMLDRVCYTTSSGVLPHQSRLGRNKCKPPADGTIAQWQSRGLIHCRATGVCGGIPWLQVRVLLVPLYYAITGRWDRVDYGAGGYYKPSDRDVKKILPYPISSFS
jgi:hypothetical protein